MSKRYITDEIGKSVCLEKQVMEMMYRRAILRRG